MQNSILKFFNPTGKSSERAVSLVPIVNEICASTDVKKFDIKWEVIKVNGEDELVPVVHVEKYKKGSLLNE